jgi:Domain of unknown function (DUF4157)
MERHQRIQLKKTSRSTNQPFQVSPFQTSGFGVQQKAAATPASKTELWENYQRSTQMTQKGSNPNLVAIQAKLTIGQPGDKYEQEADSVADRVMAMSEPAQVQREELEEDEEELSKPLAGTISPLLQRDDSPQEEEEDLQMKEASTPNSQLPTDSLEDRLSGSKGGGSPLSDDVRSFMEPRFGADFSGVRVHTGSDAVQMNQDVNAQAFAHGQDVYFGAGKAPGKDALTAHELTHVVQQTGMEQAKIAKVGDRHIQVQHKCDVCEQQNTKTFQTQESYSETSFDSKDLLQRVAGVDDAVEAGILMKVLMNCVSGALVTGVLDEGVQIGTWAWKKWWKKQDIEFRQDWCKTLVSALFGCVFGIAGGAFERMFFAEAAETTGKGLLIWIAKKAKIAGYQLIAGKIGMVIAKAGCSNLEEDVSSLRTVE